MALIKQTVDLGAVDGMSNQQEYKVDGFTLDENAETITQLRDILSREGIR